MGEGKSRATIARIAIQVTAIREPEVRRVDVFFYGLFMDEALLREKGINPGNRRQAFVENFSLVIGARATMVPCIGKRVHGVVYSLTHDEIVTLYSEPSVSFYRPEAVFAKLADGSLIPALCFTLPEIPLPDERNPDYAAKLKKLAERIGLPASYVSSIR